MYQTHQEQLRHVRKGCLSRPFDDLRTDGSRVETSHKHWRSLNRANPSGLKNIAHMGHDHVLRFNIRRIADIPDAASKRPFGASTYGSHHIGLVDYVAKRWNSLLETVGATEFKNLPVLIEIDSGEEFGIVHSEHASSFGGFYRPNLKDELEEGEEDDADILASVEILTDPIDLSADVDPTDLLIPAACASEPQASHPLSTSALFNQVNATL